MMILDRGTRCTTCGGRCLARIFRSHWGKPFCDRHGSATACTGCRLPLERHDPRRPALCPDCHPLAVLGQDDVRRVLPPIAAELRALGVALRSRTRVRLVTPADMPRPRPGAGGDPAGITLLSDGAAVEIRVLSGFTHARFGAVVAHETMHAYLYERGLRGADPRSEEGLCQLLAYEWLARKDGALYRAERDGIEHHPDPLYGEGFAAARAAVDRFGILDTLRALRRTGRLPGDPVPAPRQTRRNGRTSRHLRSSTPCPTQP